MKVNRMKVLSLLVRYGLVLGPLSLEVDDVATVPETRRGWYDQDPTTKKFRLNPDKVPDSLEDAAPLRATVEATRRERDELKRGRDKAVADALKPYEGIDPDKARTVLSQFGDAEEEALLKKGKDGLDEIMRKRTAKREQEIARQIEEADGRVAGAMEVAQTFMDRALDGVVATAAQELGDVHADALGDIKRNARELFSFDDEGNPVQFDEDGETIILGKDGKTPFSVKEWLEGMRPKAKHWFMNGSTGGGATGSNGGAGGGISLDGKTPQQLLTEARSRNGGDRPRVRPQS